MFLRINREQLYVLKFGKTESYGLDVVWHHVLALRTEQMEGDNIEYLYF